MTAAQKNTIENHRIETSKQNIAHGAVNQLVELSRLDDNMAKIIARDLMMAISTERISAHVRAELYTFYRSKP